MRIAVAHPQTPFVRGGAETHTEALVARAARGRPRRRGGRRRRQVVPGDRARASDGRVARARPLRVQRAADRHGHRAQVPGVPRAARAQGRVADPPAPQRVRAVGPPGVRRPRRKQDEGPAVRDMVEQSDRIALGEAKRIFTNSQQRAGSAVELASACRATCCTTRRRSSRRSLDARAGPVRRRRGVPEPARGAEAAVARRRGDAAREDGRAAGPRRRRSRRAGDPRADRQARARGPGRARGARPGRAPARALPRRARRVLRARSTRTTATSRSRGSPRAGRS